MATLKKKRLTTLKMFQSLFLLFLAFEIKSHVELIFGIFQTKSFEIVEKISIKYYEKLVENTPTKLFLQIDLPKRLFFNLHRF